jgi:hypothetical protein
MAYRKWDGPEIEDWEDDSEYRLENERQLYVGFHCCPRRWCWPRQGCWPTQSCWPRQGCWPS